MTYLKAIEAGCDGIDTAIAPFSMGTSQPATEAMYTVMKNTDRCPELKEDKLLQTAEYFREYRRWAEKEGLIDIKMMDADTKRCIIRFREACCQICILRSENREWRIAMRKCFGRFPG